MKLLRKTALFIALSMSVAGVQAAYAEEATANNQELAGTTGTVSTVVYSKADPALMGQIDQLYVQLLDLRQQTKDLGATMKAQHTQNEAAIKALRANVDKSDIEKIKESEAQKKAIRESNKDLMEQAKSLNQQLKQARSEKDEAKTKELKLQLNELKGELQAVVSQIKTINDTIKTTRQAVEASRKQYKGILDQIKALDQQMKPLWSEIKGNEKQKAEAWKTFDAAVNAGDTQAALSALTQIVSLKQSILTDMQKIYALQQQLGSVLNVTLN